MTHHLGDIQATATSAIVTGDPDRVPMLCDALGGARATWRKRGFVCVQLLDERLMVCSTGIGGPATAIVAEELAQVGVTSIVRVGTCGSMQPSVRPGHLVISAVLQQDLPVTMGVTIVAAMALVIANLIVDIVYAVVDPRVSYS